jgi:hypothetical protein
MKKLSNSNKTEICLLLIIFGLTLAGFLLKKMFEIKSSMSVSLNMGDVVEQSIKAFFDKIVSSENTTLHTDAKQLITNNRGTVEGNINKTLEKTNTNIGGFIKFAINYTKLVVTLGFDTNCNSLNNKLTGLVEDIFTDIKTKNGSSGLDNTMNDLLKEVKQQLETQIEDNQIKDIHPLIKDERGKCFFSLDTDEIYNLLRENMEERPDNINKITKIKERVDLGIRILKTMMIMLIALSALLFVTVIASHYGPKKNGLFKTLLKINRIFVKFVIMLFGLVLFLLGIGLLVIGNNKKYKNKIQDLIDDNISVLNDTINNVIDLNKIFKNTGQEASNDKVNSELLENIINIEHITYQKLVPKVGWILWLIGFVMFVICLFL